MTHEIRMKLELLIKLDKAYTECHWDYEEALEYKNIREASRYAVIEDNINRKRKKVWEQINDEYGVFAYWCLPKEIKEYYENGISKNKYDRFNNYLNDLKELGVELPRA